MENNRAFKGVWIPADIWLSKKLSLVEKVMLVEIDSLDNEYGCFALNKHFADFFNLSKSRVSQIIKSLEDKKMINVNYQYDGKQIKQRTIRINREGFNKLNTPLKFSKHPPLENAVDSNTEFSNTDIKEREQPENNQTIIQNYQQKIGIISPNQMEELYKWLDDFKEVNENEAESIINYAIDKSEEESAYSFSYLNTKLRKLATNKATTLERAKLLLNNKKNKNGKGKTDKSGNEYVDFDEMFKGMED